MRKKSYRRGNPPPEQYRQRKQVRQSWQYRLARKVTGEGISSEVGYGTSCSPPKKKAVKGRQTCSKL